MSQEQHHLYPRTPELMKDTDMSQKNSCGTKTVPLILGPENTKTTCPFCNSSIKTSVKYRSTTRTHITAALCCLICCCCCIPYCMDSAKNSDHYCPSCSNYIGTYEK